MIESRCGILCGQCQYREQMGCAGCVNIQKPFYVPQLFNNLNICSHSN